MDLHARVWVTTMIVQSVCVAVSAVWWWRGIDLERAVIVLQRIVGLLVLSSALLGARGAQLHDVPVLHIVYPVVFVGVWMFQWRLLTRFAPVGAVPQYWAVSALIALVVLQRIGQTGSHP